MLPAGGMRDGYWAGGCCGYAGGSCCGYGGGSCCGYGGGSCCGYAGGGCCAKGYDVVLDWIVPADLSSICWLLVVRIWVLWCFIITIAAIQQIVTTIITKIKPPITPPTIGPIVLDADNEKKKQTINQSSLCKQYIKYIF